MTWEERPRTLRSAPEPTHRNSRSAHDILIAYYHIVRDKVPYQDLGPEWNTRRHTTEQQTRRLVRQLERLGLNVTIEPTA